MSKPVEQKAANAISAILLDIMSLYAEKTKLYVRELTSITSESQLRSEEDAEESGIYNIIIFRVTHTNPHQPRHTSQRMKEDFKVQSS